MEIHEISQKNRNKKLKYKTNALFMGKWNIG